MNENISINDILFSRFSEPAAILLYKNGEIKTETINDRFLPEMGMNMDEQEYISADFMSCFDKANRQEFTNAVKKCVETHEEVTCETWRRLISNCCGVDKICIRSRLVFFEDCDGDSRVYEAIRNITSDRKNVDTLVANERGFKIAIDQANVYFWELNLITHEMRPCFRCMRDLGLPAVVKNYPEPVFEMGIFPMDYYDQYHDWLRQLSEGREEVEGDIPLTAGRIPFRVRLKTEFDADGKPVKAYGSATMLTDTEKNQRKLDTSIIEALAAEYDGIFLADVEADTFKIIWQQNDSISDGRLTDGTYTEAVGRFAPYFSEQYGESLDSMLDREYIRNELFKDTDRREYNLRHKGRGIWIRVMYQVVEAFDDKPTKFLIVYSTIDDLRAQKMDADRLIAAQKKELEEQQVKLIEAVESANRANHAKSDFLAKMSHEIRTPMNAIMGMNEIIKKTASDEMIRGYASDAYNAALGLLGTINEILDFSKIESGKMELVKGYYSTVNFLDGIYNLFALRAEDKGLALVFDIDSSLPVEMYGDELRMRQILVNLMSNAVKYTETGTVTFRMKCMDNGDDFAMIRYEVTDTGRGIKPEDMQTLFEAFGRIEEQRDRSIEGTGLGMNITTRLLEMMESKLDVESEYGKGSTFSFTVKQGTRSKEQIGVFHAGMDEQDNTEGEPMYVNPRGVVLVVDDNVVNLKVIAALLKETGMKIVPVVSGEVALKTTLQKRFDLIFMDHYMPGMDGIETFKRLREQEGGLNRETPVVALTANAIKGADEEYRAMGFDDVVYKPTTQQELNAVLWKLLGNK